MTEQERDQRLTALGVMRICAAHSVGCNCEVCEQTYALLLPAVTPKESGIDFGCPNCSIELLPAPLKKEHYCSQCGYRYVEYVEQGEEPDQPVGEGESAWQILRGLAGSVSEPSPGEGERIEGQILRSDLSMDKRLKADRGWTAFYRRSVPLWGRRATLILHAEGEGDGEHPGG